MTALDRGRNGWSAAGDLLLFVTLAAVCFAMALYKEVDVDLGFHIRTGEYVLRTGTIPQKDIFSYTCAGKEWPLHYWMPDVLLALVYEHWGLEGLTLAKCAVVAMIFLVLYGGMRRMGIHWPLALTVVVWALVMARPRFSIRPLLGSQLFLAVLVVWWMLARAGRGLSVRFLPVLLMIWANVHAGMVYGVILLATVSGVEVLKRIAGRLLGLRLPGFSPERLRSLIVWSAAGVGVSALLVWVMNPLSLKGLLLPFEFYRSEFFMNVIEEYRHVALPRDSLFGLMLIASAAAFILNRRNLDWTELALVGVFGYLAATSARIMIVFGIVTAPILARNVQEALGERAEAVRRRTGPRGRLAVAAAVSAALGLSAFAYIRADRAFRPGFGFDDRTFPEKAFRFIERTSPDGEIFNSDIWGGPMILRLYPRYKVFVDGRQEVYEEAFWRDTYFRILAAGPGWDETLARYGVNLALLRNIGPRYGHRISQAMWESPGWELVYWDDLTSLFARTEERNRKLLESSYRTIFPDGFDVEVLRSEGRLAEAALELERKVEEDPDCWKARLYLGQVYAASSRNGDALAAFRAILDRKLMEGPGAALVGLGDAQTALGFPDSALQSYRRARGQGVSDRVVRIKEIRALGLLGREAEALERIGKIADAPGREEAGGVLARALSEAGRGDDAVRLLQDSVRRDPKDARLRYDLGQAYERMDRLSDAEAAYREALKCRPDFPEALNNLAWILASDPRRIDEAESLAERAHALRPSDPQILDTLGWVQYLAGKGPAAVASLREAVNDLGPVPGPGAEEILYHLGSALESSGDRAGAAEAYSQALGIFPEHAGAREGLARTGGGRLPGGGHS